MSKLLFAYFALFYLTFSCDGGGNYTAMLDCTILARSLLANGRNGEPGCIAYEPTTDYNPIGTISMSARECTKDCALYLLRCCIDVKHFVDEPAWMGDFR